MQKTTNQIALFIGLCLIIGLSGELLFYLNVTQFDSVTKIATVIGRLGGLIFLISHGTLIKRRPFYPLIMAFIGLTIMGALMKIMHWSNANLVLLSGHVAIPVIYAIHFFKKQVKHRLDVLKFLWVIVFFTASIFVIHHLPFGQELKTLEGLLFLFVFTDFVYGLYRVKNQRRTTD